MRKDIFIDNNIASKFSNPLDKEYLKLIKWLVAYDAEKPIEELAHLAVSQKLLVEYSRSSRNALSGTSIPSIVDKLTREGRLIMFKKVELDEFKREHLTKSVERKLKCNNEDRDLIPVVLLSDRRFALTYDDNFTIDLRNFPGFEVRVEKRPENLPYQE